MSVAIQLRTDDKNRYWSLAITKMINKWDGLGKSEAA